MSEVTYAGRTITTAEFADARGALSMLALRAQRSPLDTTITVDGITTTTGDMDFVLTLATAMFWRLSQEQG